MFERIVKAFTPFGLSLVLIAGLALTGRIPVLDERILGYATIVVASALIVVHVTNELRGETKKQPKRKD